MMNTTLAPLIIASLMLSQPAMAQPVEPTHGQWDIRVGAAGTADPVGTELLGRGAGVDATVAFNLASRAGIYLGWSWYHFTGDDYRPGLGDEIRTEATILALGLQWQDRVGGCPVSEYRLRAGITRSRLRFEGRTGAVTSVDNDQGWELEGAILTDLNSGWKLIQTLRFRTQRNSVVLANNEGLAKLRQFSYNIGISRSF